MRHYPRLSLRTSDLLRNAAKEYRALSADHSKQVVSKMAGYPPPAAPGPYYGFQQDARPIGFEMQARAVQRDNPPGHPYRAEDLYPPMSSQHPGYPVKPAAPTHLQKDNHGNTMNPRSSNDLPPVGFEGISKKYPNSEVVTATGVNCTLDMPSPEMSIRVCINFCIAVIFLLNCIFFTIVRYFGVFL